MRQSNFFKSISLVLFLMFQSSCSEESSGLEEIKDPEGPNISQSITKVAFDVTNTSTPVEENGEIVRDEYDFSAGESIKVNLEGFNTDYSYKLKLEGQYLNFVYFVDLTLADENSTVTPKQQMSSNMLYQAAESTSIEVNLEDLDLEPDFYNASVIENESNTEIPIETPQRRPYAIIDRDAVAYYGSIRITDTNSGILYTLDLNESQFRVLPSENMEGLAMALALYDKDANFIQFVRSSGGRTVGGVTDYISYSSIRIDSPITRGAYLFRLEEVESPEDPVNKIYKRTLFKHIIVEPASD